MPPNLLPVSDVLAPLMLLPGVKAALEEADQAIAGVSLQAKRHASRIADTVMTMATVATAELESEPDVVLAATLIQSVDQLPDLKAAPLQALAQLHAIAAVSEPQERRGRPRSDFDENDRLLALADVAKSPSPALVVAAVLHAEILSMAPFASHNGLVARAMARAVLVQRGIDSLLGIEVGLKDFGAQVIEKALEKYESATPQGVSEWIGLNAKSLVFSAQALRDVLAK